MRKEYHDRTNYCQTRTKSHILSHRLHPQSQRRKQPRQLVRFAFYKLDPQWQLLPSDVRERGKEEMKRLFDAHAENALIRSFRSLWLAFRL